jgi:hypothetical protein
MLINLTSPRSPWFRAYWQTRLKIQPVGISPVLIIQLKFGKWTFFTTGM